MTLKEKIDQDFIEAYKNKDTDKVSVLRMLKSAIKNFEINEKHPSSDDDILKVLKKEAKQRRDSIEEYGKAGRPDLIDQEEKELKLLNEYLPAQLSPDEVRIEVEKIVASTGASSISDLGKVMSLAVASLGSKADGAIIAKIAREILEK